MSTLTFDTLRYTERLRAAGVPEQQAKVEAEALRDVLSEALDSTLATKADIARLESAQREGFAGSRRDLDDLRKDMQSNMQSLELRLTVKLGAFMAMSVGIFITVLKAF